MRGPWGRERILGTARLVLLVIVVSLAAAAVLGSVYAVATGRSFLDGFSLMSFAVFFLLLFYAFLSGPGTFPGRPGFATLRRRDRPRSERRRAGPTETDREFHELVL